MSILVTGGAGFIGSNFIQDWLEESDEPVINLDKLTHASNPDNLAALADNPAHVFVQGDIGDQKLVEFLLRTYEPRAVINFAAESYFDRKIHGIKDAIHTNIFGIERLLEVVRIYYGQLGTEGRTSARESQAQSDFRFIHVSSYQAYGSLGPKAPAFIEIKRKEGDKEHPIGKDASDQLVRAYYYCFGLPVLTTNSANNYGPYHFSEKLIPHLILKALAGEPLPIHGDGLQIRDWLYVKDHCRAIRRVLEAGTLGELYNIGSGHEKSDLEVVNTLCSVLDELKPRPDGSTYRSQVTFVNARPRRERRYTIDPSKIQRELGWQPAETFESGLRKTVQWYLDHPEWVKNVTSATPPAGRTTPAQPH